MSPPTASYVCHVLPAEAFRVVSGANLGDPLTLPETLAAGDVYRLAPDRAAARLAVDGAAGSGRTLLPDGAGHRVGEGSDIGAAGAPLHLAARLSLLAPEGHRADLLLLALGERVAALPLDPMAPGEDHVLVAVDEAPAPVALVDTLAMGFARGTRLAGADGRLMPVEAILPGTALRTRDTGPQPLRRMLRRTLRGVGAFAPVVLSAGTLGAAGDLVLSPNQRLFVYQRGAERLADRAELLVRAGHLVDGDRVWSRPGGFIDWFTPVLDRHEILFAEGVPVESLEASPEILAALPAGMGRELAETLPDLAHRPHPGTEADPETAAAARSRLLRRDR